MKHNMGTVDRLLRTFIVAPVAIVLSFVVFGAWTAPGIVALVIAGIMLATSAVGFCPTYTLFGLSTVGGISTHRHVRTGGRALPQH